MVNLHQPPMALTFEPDGPVEHAVVAAAEAFATTPEILLGTDRSRVVADARSVGMTDEPSVHRRVSAVVTYLRTVGHSDSAT